jgi:hypothetical protein
MGEYAVRRSDGERVKIGTCEQMYYLRADQIGDVDAEEGSVDPERHGREGSIRFRFPWPDEDGAAPGTFEDYSRSLVIPGYAPPTELADSHYPVQFTAKPGYVCSLPCPESGNVPSGLRVNRNGFRGAARLVSQRYIDSGALVPVLQCACGMQWRVEDWRKGRRIAAAIIGEAQRCERQTQREDAGAFYRTVAERIMAGYKQGAEVVA